MRWPRPVQGQSVKGLTMQIKLPYTVRYLLESRNLCFIIAIRLINSGIA